MKTVQQYIDERPVWPDGTHLPSAPMTQMQWLIWSLAAAGKFFVGYVVFMTGVTLPLISREFDIGSAQDGLISAASLLGILVGAVGLGGMSDRFGRKPMFIFEMIVFVAFLVLLMLCSNFLSVVICLFGLGLALGCDYPTAHMIIAENISSFSRGRLVLAAFGFQALGALGGTAVGLVVLSNLSDLSAWRWMYATAIVPALAVTIGRFYVTESANWLHARGAVEKAQRAATRLLVRKPQYPANITLIQHAVATAEVKHESGFAALFARQNRRATILASVPWFLQDLGTYGIGIFTPTILAATIGGRVDHVRSVVDLIADGIGAAKGAALIALLLSVGNIFAVLLADRVGRISLQIIGFLGCAAGLLLASFSTYAPAETKLVLMFAGFMLFNFMTNLGPSAQTYLLAGELFPTTIRGKGAGFAAAVGKIGAVTTAFLFPILLTSIGTTPLLYILVVTSILGAIVTWTYRIETTGVNLDEIEPKADPETQETQDFDRCYPGLNA